jgi:hypothetical protein
MRGLSCGKIPQKLHACPMRNDGLKAVFRGAKLQTMPAVFLL